MKKISLLLVLLFIFASCEKEEDQLINTTTSYDGKGIEFYQSFRPEQANTISLLSTKVSTIEGRNGVSMLQFESLEDFDELMNYLTKESDDSDFAFTEMLKPLKEEKFMEYETKVEYNEELPLMYFENQFAASNFESLRNTLSNNPIERNIQGKIVVTTPSHALIDEVLQTLLNKNGEIMVGNEIHVYYPNGTYYRISDKNTNVLHRLTDENAYTLMSSPYIVEANLSHTDNAAQNRATCFPEAISEREFFIDGQHMYQLRVQVKNGVLASYYFAKSKHYSPNGRGIWKPKRIQMNVRIFNPFREECNDDISLIEDGEKVYICPPVEKISGTRNRTQVIVKYAKSNFNILQLLDMLFGLIPEWGDTGIVLNDIERNQARRNIRFNASSDTYSAVDVLGTEQARIQFAQ